MRKQVLSLLVENTSGVLSHISGLFSRRGYNIDSFSAGVTADPRFTRITVVSSGDEQILEQIEKQLNKKIDVIKVRRFAENKCVTRELLMLKVTYTNVTRSDIMEICNITGAHIADLSPKSMVIELTAKTSKIDRFIKLMQPFGIIEMARTGALAVQRDSNE